MRTLLIGFFILVFLGSIAAKQMSHAPASQTSWVGGLMNMIGLKRNDKVQPISEKSASVLDKVKEQQTPLKDLNQDNLANLSSLTDKINDSKQRSADLIENNNRRNQAQEQILKDHLRDQLERIQDQRNK